MNRTSSTSQSSTPQSGRDDSQWLPVVQVVVGLSLVTAAGVGYGVLNSLITVVPVMMGIPLLLFGARTLLTSRDAARRPNAGLHWSRRHGLHS